MIEHIKQIIKYRELLKNFIVRDLKLKYKNSVLGYFWSLLDPLLTMLLFIFVFSIIMKFKEVENYPVFLISAILPWSFVQMSLNGTLMSLVQYRQLIRKIYFPRQLLPYSVVITYLVNLMLSFIVLVPILLIYKIKITGYIVFLPLAVILLAFFILGLGLILSSMFVFFYDTLYATNSVTRFWFYASPIIYPVEIVPERFRTLYMLNPLAPIISLFRSAFLGTPPPETVFILYAIFISFFIFFLGIYIFNKSENSMVKII